MDVNSSAQPKIFIKPHLNIVMVGAGIFSLISLGLTLFVWDALRTDRILHESFLPTTILITGTVLSLLLFSFLYFLATTRQRAILLAQEITEKLRESEEQYRTIFEHLQDVYYETDLQGRITMISPSIYTYTGLKSEEIIGKDATLFYKDPHQREEMITQMKQSGEVRDYEVKLLGKSGKVINTSVTAQILHNKIGLPRGVAGILRDITKRKSMEEKLKEKNHELENAHIELEKFVKQLKEDKKMLEDAMTKDEFLSIAAHQLRTPLGIIRWTIESLLRKKKLSQRYIITTLKEIYTSNLSLIKLVNDLLDVSRINQHRVKDNSQEINIVDVIKTAVKGLEEQAKLKDVAVDFLTKEKAIITYLDPYLFTQVIQNLVSNAIKYNVKSGKVVVTLKKDKEVLHIEIADTGIGIPDKDQKHIFEKFSRGSNVSKGTIEGTGLGLFVVKSYIEGWGGKIHLTSKELKGTTVYITIPMRYSKGTSKSRKVSR